MTLHVYFFVKPEDYPQTEILTRFVLHMGWIFVEDYYKQNVSVSGNGPDLAVIILRKFIDELNCYFLYISTLRYYTRLSRRRKL